MQFEKHIAYKYILQQFPSPISNIKDITCNTSPQFISPNHKSLLEPHLTWYMPDERRQGTKVGFVKSKEWVEKYT